MDYKMVEKHLENYLERSFSRGRKDISGKGATFTKVRIVDDVIFVKMKLEFSGLEKKLFKFITSQDAEASYYHSVRSESTAVATMILRQICPQVNIKTIHFNVDMENGFSFSTVILDYDLEKLIKEGKVTLPENAS